MAELTSRRRGLTLAAAPVLGLLLAMPAAAQGQRGDASLFSLPRSQDENFELNKAREDLAAAAAMSGPAARELLYEAVERLHRLVTKDSRGVLQVGLDRFHGLHREVLGTLRELSPEAQEIYHDIVEREGGAMLRRAPVDLSSDQLLELAERFPAAPQGRRARQVLGDRALEAGRGGEATQHYLAALDATRPESDEADVLQQRMQAARVLAQPTQYSVLPQPQMDPETVTQVMGALPTGGDQTWPGYAGGGAGTRPMQSPAGNPVPEWELRIVAPGFDDNYLAMHGVGDLGGIYINNGRRVYAISPLGRSVSWIADGPMVGENSFNRGGVVNPEMVLSAAVGDDVVVAALQVPDETDNIVFRRGMAIVTPIPERRLFAFDRDTGKRLWAHWDHLNGPLDRLYRGQIPCGPPLVHGDTVYVPSHDPRGTIAFYLTAYDLHSGELRWRRLLCSSQQEVNMFGNANMEFASSPLALDGGVLYGSTNLGLCFAADAATGRIRWLSAYEVVPLPPARGRYRGTRPTYFANNAPIVVDGVVACTPLDSYNVLGLDTETGQQLWRLSWRARTGSVDHTVRWLLGAIGDEFVVSGLGVVGVTAQPPNSSLNPSVRSIKAPLAQIRVPSFTIPRGAVTDRLIYHPLISGLSVFDFKGNPDPDAADLSGLPARLGNLLMVDGIIVSIPGDNETSISYDRKNLLQMAEARVEADSQDVLALYRQAALLRADARNNVDGPVGDSAEKAYREGLRVAREQGMGPGSPLFTRLAEELFDLTLERGAHRALLAPEEALSDLRRARQDAPDQEAWLEAQMQILLYSRPQPEEYLAELDLMAERFGNELHTFPEIVGAVPAQAYSLWQASMIDELPAEAVLRCQELLETYGDEQFQISGQTLPESVADLATLRMQDLLDRHGPEHYQPIEKRAAVALERAGADSARLHEVATRFPHSRSADRAMGKLMDLAAASGDLGAAADAFAKAVAGGQESPGLLRRMMVAAERGNNTELSQSLGRLILRNYAEEASDFPEDNGEAYRNVIPVPPAAAPMAVLPQLPARVLGEIRPRVVASVLKLLPLAPAEGFRNPDNPPVYVSVNQEQLEAYSLDASGSPADSPLFEVDLEFCEEVLLCDTTLVVPEMNRVRGLNYMTGEMLWKLDSEEERYLDNLGIHGGVLHLFSLHRSNTDGGELLGVEPLTGHVLFRRVFPAARKSTPPRFSGGDFLLVESYGTSENAWIQRVDPLTGKTVAKIPLLPDTRRTLDLNINIIGQAMFVKRLFADEDTVYIPVNSRSAMGPVQLMALRPDGTAKWSWQGVNQRALLMHGMRDDRVVLVEGAPSVGSRVLIFDSETGNVLVNRQLMGSAKVLNWDLNVQPTPVPDVLMILDKTPGLRLTCLSMVENIRSFQVSLHREDSRVLAPPAILGEDFVSFGIQRDGMNQRLLLYALDLDSRSGAFPASEKYLTLPPGMRRPYEIKRHGPYTVVQSNEALTIFGNK